MSRDIDVNELIKMADQIQVDLVRGMGGILRKQSGVLEKDALVAGAESQIVIDDINYVAGLRDALGMVASGEPSERMQRVCRIIPKTVPAQP